jgi:hypothetical protein
MQRGQIDVSYDRSPAIVEYPTKAPDFLVSAIAPVALGPVRLVIDMPAKSARLLIGFTVAAVVIFAIVALEFWGLSAAIGPVSDSSFLAPRNYLTLAGVIGIATFMAGLWFAGAGARREVLAIDSRFVTLSRGGRTMTTLSRGMCDSFALAEAPTNGLPRWVSKHFSDTPQLLLGVPSTNWFIAAGSGISRESAESLGETIKAFMSEHPVERGFDDPRGALHLDRS